jgi:aryl-alcohol dehydrogenase-like predicted oxidoreductase
METVDFGRTGLRVSRLGFGTGTNGWSNRSDQTALGIDGLADLLCLAHEHGVTFWDAADQYGSHPHVARALQSVRRDSVVIATKVWSRTAKRVTRDIERFLRELGTDVLDVVLLHSMMRSDWPRRHAGMMEALSRAKEQGKVRAVGVSCHGLGALRAAAQTDWVEVVLARINHAGVNMDGEPSATAVVIEDMYNAGKAVYGMKVLGCGQLANDVRAAMAYVFQLGTVYSVSIGMISREQVIENVKVVENLAPRYPLRTIPA